MSACQNVETRVALLEHLAEDVLQDATVVVVGDFFGRGEAWRQEWHAFPERNKAGPPWRAGHTRARMARRGMRICADRKMNLSRKIHLSMICVRAVRKSFVSNPASARRL